MRNISNIITFQIESFKKRNEPDPFCISGWVASVRFIGTNILFNSLSCARYFPNVVGSRSGAFCARRTEHSVGLAYLLGPFFTLPKGWETLGTSTCVIGKCESNHKSMLTKWYFYPFRSSEPLDSCSIVAIVESKWEFFSQKLENVDHK